MKTFRYSTFKEDGSSCCGGDTEDFPRCAPCADATFISAAPEPYVPGIAAALRAAQATPNDDYRAARMLALKSEQSALDEYIEANPFPRMTAAEAEEYAPIDIYAEGIKALLEKESK